jgi:hypothetical protein
LSRWHFFAIAALPLLLSSIRSPEGPELAWWTTSALDKVRPYDAAPEPRAHDAKISAARNEFESFQIVLRAGDSDVEGLDVEVTDLRGPGAAVLAKSNVAIYLEGYLNLQTPSSLEGGTGEWPDPLVPQVDRYVHERRNAFPFTIAKQRNQPLWIEVYVPPSTPAGSYRGGVRVLVSGKPAVSIPVDLTVWNFELPSTSSLVTTFAFSGVPAIKQHYGNYTSDSALAAMVSLYQKAALWHRISLDGHSGLPPKINVSNGEVRVDWEKHDERIAPFLEGRAIGPNEPLAGARLTSVALRTPPGLKTEDQQIQFWRQAAAHFRERGWFDRMFNYLWDEPAKTQFQAMIQRGQMVRRADPTIRNLVTAPLNPDWAGFVDIWTPVINCFESRKEGVYCGGSTPRSAYENELSKGKQLWWYQACGTHGCNIIGGDYFRGWPGYMIDDAAIRNRIMEWLTWKYRIGGELYFNTNEAYFKKKDPWTDVFLFGGNGDGTLFYPGRPDKIGGSTHIPVESIRLKLIREGLEDYEYLVMLEKLKGSKTVAGIVDGIIRSAYDFDHDPQKLYGARTEIARQLDAAGRTR